MFLLFKLLPGVLLAGKVLAGGAKAKRKLRKMKKTLDRMVHPAQQKEELIMMKKTTFGAILAMLACAVGALTAAALYLRRREKELDEYEELLFGEDFNDEVPEEAPADAPEEAPAEEPAE